MYIIQSYEVSPFTGLDAAVLAELFGGGAAEVTLSAHVANSTVPSAKLVNGGVLRTLAENRLLHVTEVQMFQRRGYFRVKVGEVCVYLV